MREVSSSSLANLGSADSDFIEDQFLYSSTAPSTINLDSALAAHLGYLESSFYISYSLS